MDTRFSGLGRFLLLATASAWLLGGVPAMAAEPRPLQIYLFASSTCPECMEVKENLLPRLQQVYGDRIKVTHQVLDDIENFKLLLLYEKKYGATDDEPLRIFLAWIPTLALAVNTTGIARLVRPRRADPVGA
jgi:hypothetical protein